MSISLNSQQIAILERETSKISKRTACKTRRGAEDRVARASVLPSEQAGFFESRVVIRSDGLFYPVVILSETQAQWALWFATKNIFVTNLASLR